MKDYCVISHTHWDREWYRPLEVFQLKLVDLIDHCIVTLQKYPDYIFHLDAQTIVLEDYLSIRPSKGEILKKYIREGRLIVGPWYLQNDFYLTSGEATVRNLLEGTRLAKQFGKCAKTAYAPDQFGNISQLPQIIEGFGLNGFLFGRGYNQYFETEDKKLQKKKTPAEFIWEGADGTKVLAVHMCCWYNNAQRFSESIDRSAMLLENIECALAPVAQSPYRLLMNGVDHLEAQENLLPILEQLRQRLQPGDNIHQISMDEYMSLVKEYFKKNGTVLDSYQGELRSGNDFEMLKGTLSSRNYLKTENVRAQNFLENILEPLYSILELAGLEGVYSLEHFQFLWKELMKNHPHDSICGCSRDEVSLHMEGNYQRIRDLSDELLQRGLSAAVRHMNMPDMEKEDYILVAANTTEKLRKEWLHFTLDIALEDHMDNFEVTDRNGKAVEFQVLSEKNIRKDVFSPVNLPGTLEVKRYEILLEESEIKPYAVKAWRVKKTETPMKYYKPESKELAASNLMENEFLCVKVSSDGVVDLFDKKADRWYENIIDIEETGDRGDSYIYFDTQEPANYASADTGCVEWLAADGLKQRIRIRWRMEVPAYYDFENIHRSVEKAVCEMDLILTLQMGMPYLEIDYRVNNRAKDHRIRLMVRTGLQAKESIADIPYDIAVHTDQDHFCRTMSRVLPNTSFAALEEHGNGMAVLTEGTHEYEHISKDGTLLFTLVRSTGIISRQEDLRPAAGEIWECPQNQCLRELSGRIALLPYSGNYETAELPCYAKMFRTPILTCADSFDSHKFAGGRSAVQDSQLSELFFQEDPYKNVKIEENHSYIEVQGAGMLVTALKKAEDENGMILRLVNYTQKEQKAKVHCNVQAVRCRMDETKTDADKGESADPNRNRESGFSTEVRKKEILTLRIGTR